MDVTKFVPLGIPLLLFFTDIINLFAPPHHHQTSSSRPTKLPITSTTTTTTTSSSISHSDFDEMQKTSSIGTGIGAGILVNINFCTSSSYRGHAVTMKNMLEAAFPGIHVVLANHPPPLLKRMLGKVVPIFQIGIIVIIMGGEQIFLRLGYMTTPPWYYSLRANRFGTIASTWLFGNFIQSYLQTSGAFEVFCNGELIFSKLMEHRFPSEFELRELVNRRLVNLKVAGGLGAGFWS